MPLYPEIEPHLTGFLDVSPTHSLYYEEVGNPDGKPILFVHGGPGGGISPSNRQYFDPKAWRVILFDQRGAGKSTPSASLDSNTTWDLVEDMEKLRIHCGIDKWALFGGSWGSTLCLAYAVTFTSRCSALILRGIFTVRQRELEWLYEDKGVGGGAADVYPDEWEKYVKPIPFQERQSMMSAYYKRLTSQDSQIRLEAAKAWSSWECAVSTVLPDSKLIAKADEPEWALAFARIECHYFVNHGFMRDGELLEKASLLKSIPGIIVQGRLDMVCPTRTAWDLHKVWGAKLIIVEGAGHSAREPGIQEALVSAVDSFR
jgi:proline iminopeptidase